MKTTGNQNKKKVLRYEKVTTHDGYTKEDGLYESTK